MNPRTDQIEQAKQDIKWMEYALGLAHKAELQGEVPVGAIIILNQQVIGEGWNQPITLSDPSAHAEILALRQAGIQTNNYRLTNTTLYVTLEPCIMCLGAMIHARIKRLVFAAKDPKIGAVCSTFGLIEQEQFNHQIDWDILQEMEKPCSDKLKHFFRAKRFSR